MPTGISTRVDPLRSWLAASPRSWRDIVAVFVAAGRGLLAAHRAGLVLLRAQRAGVVHDAAADALSVEAVHSNLRVVH